MTLHSSDWLITMFGTLSPPFTLARCCLLLEWKSSNPTSVAHWIKDTVFFLNTKNEIHIRGMYWQILCRNGNLYFLFESPSGLSAAMKICVCGWAGVRKVFVYRKKRMIKLIKWCQQFWNAQEIILNGGSTTQKCYGFLMSWLKLAMTTAQNGHL